MPSLLRRGPIESVRVLREARDQMVKARTAALNTLRGLLITAPAELRESLAGLNPAPLVAACAELDTTTLPAPGTRGAARAHARTELATALRDSDTVTRTALAALAATITGHNQRITELDTHLDTLTATIAPAPAPAPAPSTASAPTPPPHC